MSHEVEDFLQSLKSNAEVVFDDGTRFEGISFGADVSASGEAVFQTGKQEHHHSKHTHNGIFETSSSSSSSSSLSMLQGWSVTLSL